MLAGICRHLKTKPPEALLAGGIVPADTEVTFTSDTSGADIYYTTDGTDPNVNSQKGNSVTINGTPGEVVTVKALAVKDGMMESDIATFTYTIAKPSSKQSGSSYGNNCWWDSAGRN